MYKFSRLKKRNLFHSLLYRGFNLIPISRKSKVDFCSSIAHVLSRIAYESSSHIRFSEAFDQWVFRKDFILAEVTESDIILDFGCSSGATSSIVAEKANFVFGVDLDPTAIERAKNRAQTNTEFFSTDGMSFLKRRNESFSATLLSHVLEHLENPTEVLRDLKGRSAKIYIEVPDNDATLIQAIRVAMGLAPLVNDNDHLWEFTRDAIMQTFDEVGLSVIRKEFKYGNMYIWLRSGSERSITNESRLIGGSP